jgi:hypothetical protein
MLTQYNRLTEQQETDQVNIFTFLENVPDRVAGERKPSLKLLPWYLSRKNVLSKEQGL